MNALKVWLAVALVFTAGFVGGSVFTRAVTRHTIQRVLNNPNQLRILVERRLAGRLKLQAEQRDKIDSILAQTQHQLRTLRQQFTPQFHLIMSNTQVEIESVLTPQQRERFDRLRAENRALWQPK